MNKFVKPWFLSALFIITSLTRGVSQSSAIVWQSCQTLTSGEYASSICHAPGGYLVMRSGRFIIGGLSGVTDIFLSKFDTIGNLQWTKKYGGSKKDFGSKIVAVNSNLYYVVGKTNSTNGDVQSGNKGGYDLWVFAVDSTGTLLWEKTYGTADNDFPADLTMMPEGGFMLGGNITTAGGDVDTTYGGTDFWLCRCDVYGNIVWKKTYGAEGYNNCTGFILNSKGNLVITGTNSGDYFSGCYSPENQNVFILESDLDGNILWNRCYGSWGADVGCSVIEYHDGYLFLATVNGGGEYVEGYHNNPNKKIQLGDIWLVKTDHQGLIQWQNCMGGRYDDVASAIVIDPDDEINVFGYTSSNDFDVSGCHQLIPGDNSDYWMVKLTSEGVIRNQSCFGGLHDEEITGQTSVLLKNKKQFVIAGNTLSSSTGDLTCSYSRRSLWLIEAERCGGYEPGVPLEPAGKEIVYTSIDSVSEYSITPPENSWGFDWKLVPDTSGTLQNLGVYATINWSTNFKGKTQVYARTSNLCGWSEWSVPHEVTVEKNIGITTHSLAGLRIWPNPASRLFNIELPATATLPVTFNLSDLSGRVVLHQTLSERVEKVNCSLLAEGAYFWTVKTGDKTTTGKVVIQK